MNSSSSAHDGKALSWQGREGVIELALQREAHALIIYSDLKAGFCAGADLRELYHRSEAMDKAEALKGVRDFLERIHRVLNLIDAAPLTTIAAVHGVTFGGGFELALACDLVIGDT